MLSRRRLLSLGSGSILAALVGGACSSTDSDQATRESEPTPVATTDPDDLAARFAGFEAADEPNGDLTRVEWPDYVTEPGGDVQELYEFQITHGELMRYMPCFCGCGGDAGHRSNRDCYVERINEDGSVVFDSMAPT